ncbi:MAG: 1-deoxy-D-xylulose-5-phosphate reductoisomerase [Lachnospiraceae bacterium]|nr:1-deoxy-D-xylulose-5-phosphate reductoisomerase [Lachnospiraceae bacterium]
MKKIGILGSTGSIGTQTLEIARTYNKDLKVVALSAAKNIDLMESQAREFGPKIVCMYDEKAAEELRIRLADTDVKVLAGMEGLLELAVLPEMDMLVTAVVGMIGIRPTIAAIEAGKDIALANKETLVTAGHIIMPLAASNNVSILPVDSEHSAIFQSLQGRKESAVGGDSSDIDKILLTASGGPFRGKTLDELKTMTVSQALKHPNWSMGPKITIDSSTLCNKGLEVIEAKWLFNVDIDRIEVVIHPESVVHSGVQFIDGAVIAEMGIPDMKLPIQYALFYPDRRPMTDNRVDLFSLGALHFEKPDEETFKGLRLAKDAAKKGGNTPTVFNAANEKAVALFLKEKISFLKIYDIIERCIDEVGYVASPSLDDILATERECYERIETWIHL